MIIEKFKYNTMTNNIKFFLLLFMLSNLGNACGGIYNEGLVRSITCAVNSLDLGFRVV
jgi:hypothetical protein